MTWNYRVIRHRKSGEDDFLEIHEVYYNEDGEPTSVTQEGVSAGDETIEGLRETLDLMKQALDEPILDFEYFDTLSEKV